MRGRADEYRGQVTPHGRRRQPAAGMLGTNPGHSLLADPGRQLDRLVFAGEFDFNQLALGAEGPALSGAPCIPRTCTWQGT